MASPNRRRLERGHMITVTLIGTRDADVFVLRPDGGGEYPTRIDLTPFFAAGMEEGEALEAAPKSLQSACGARLRYVAVPVSQYPVITLPDF